MSQWEAATIFTFFKIFLDSNSELKIVINAKFKYNQMY